MKRNDHQTENGATSRKSLEEKYNTQVLSLFPFPPKTKFDRDSESREMSHLSIQDRSLAYCGLFRTSTFMVVVLTKKIHEDPLDGACLDHFLPIQVDNKQFL